MPAERGITLKVGDDEITFAGIRAAIGSVARAHGRIDGLDGRVDGVDDRLDLEIGAAENRASTLITRYPSPPVPPPIYEDPPI